MAKKPSPERTKVTALLNTITQTAPSPPSPAPPASGKRSQAKSQPPQQPAVRQSGRFSSIYLNPEDEKIIRETALWCTGQGLRINDSLIVRIALRMLRTGSEFLAAHQEAVKSDRRSKKSVQ